MSEAKTPVDIAALRRNYTRAGLAREDLAVTPVEQFRRWFDESVESGVFEPNAMILSTSNGIRPSSRTVLLKAFDSRGFVFFTNYQSRKARDIAADPNVSLLFPWYVLERQVSILGRAERISVQESLAYFVSRPHGSRLGAWVSQQSSVIGSRQLLEMKWEEMKQKFGRGEIPLPEFWGGFRVIPSEVEFWQGRENRLHDRFRYTLRDGDWSIERLAP